MRSEPVLRPAGTFLPRVRAPPSAPWPDRGLESLRSPCCRLAIHKKMNSRESQRKTGMMSVCSNAINRKPRTKNSHKMQTYRMQIEPTPSVVTAVIACQNQLL
ncbi:hypothetical protein PoB_002102700 [Plakobranchus ocellatus]|uniref:Uncharacterized protein n=1 Tax=Plakobranchus ocellatus TaxID=259542 RepID=A0AAV3ZJ13_9GAST|nr:hypothetical protein PoB_002102700 [Plakobranchus ocellatus]